MKAIVKTAEGPGHLELRDVPEPPPPGPGEVKIQVEAAGICGSDLHIQKGDIGIPIRPPFILGHEFAGRLVEMGPDVTGWQVGDRVTAENTRIACGRCPSCLTGSYNLCGKRLATGYAFDGAFARYCVVPAIRLHRLPDTVDFESGALTDPSACVYHAIQDGRGIQAGETVLITGAGAMGLFSVQYAKANGARVLLTGLERSRPRLALGLELGADQVVVTDREALAPIIDDFTDGLGVDVALECSGAESAANQCLQFLRTQGRFTQIGIYGAPIRLDLDQVVYKEIQLTGSFSQKNLAWQGALRFQALGLVKAAPLISDRLSIDQWSEGFHRFATGQAIKVVFNRFE